MASKYNILFVPPIEIRRKVSPIRTRICKMVHSTQALQYPIHMSLISGGFQVKNYSTFEKELRLLCKKEKSMTLKTEKFTAVLPDRFWTGIHIVRTEELTKLQKGLQILRNKYAIKEEKHQFHPLHITLAFPAKVDGLKKIKCPIGSIVLDRVTIVKKDAEIAPYKIYKHIKIG